MTAISNTLLKDGDVRWSVMLSLPSFFLFLSLSLWLWQKLLTRTAGEAVWCVMVAGGQSVCFPRLGEFPHVSARSFHSSTWKYNWVCMMSMKNYHKGHILMLWKRGGFPILVVGCRNGIIIQLQSGSRLNVIIWVTFLHSNPHLGTVLSRYLQKTLFSSFSYTFL